MYNLITPNQLFPLCVGKRSAVDTWAHLIALGPLCHLETALIRGWLLAQDPPSLPTFSLSLSPYLFSPYFFLSLFFSLCWGGRKRPGSLADSPTLSYSSHPACLILVQPFTRHARTICGPIQGRQREKSRLLEMSLFQGKLLLLLAAAAGRYTVKGRSIGNNQQEKGTWKSHFVRHEDNGWHLFFFVTGCPIMKQLFQTWINICFWFYSIKYKMSILHLGTSHFLLFLATYLEC